MAGRFSVEAIFKAVDRITSPIKKMQRGVARLTRKMGNSFKRLNSQMDSFSSGMKRAAVATTLAFTIAAASMANVIGVGAEFQQTLVNAAAKFPGQIKRGTEAFQQLADAAREVGRTTEFTATQSAQALNFLAMAGFNAEQSIGALPGVVNLATTAQVDLATATDISTDSLGAFGLLVDDAAQRSKNLARINDALAFTATSANTGLVQMFEAIRDGAPAAVAAGASVETITTLIGKMADSGIKGTKAGTGLKNIFLAIGAPGSAAARVFRKLGVETTDVAGDVRDVLDVFEDFSKTVLKLPTGTQLKVFKEIFGKIPIAAAIGLTKAAKGMKAFREETEKAVGINKKMATIMRDTVTARFKNLQSAIESVKITLFDMNEGPLADTIDKMTNWVRVNEQLIATKINFFIQKIIDNLDEIGKRIKQVTGLIVAFVALNTAIKVLNLTFIIINGTIIALTVTMGLLKNGMVAVAFVAGVMSKAFRALGITIALAFLLNPVGLFIAAVVILIGLAALVITAWEPVKTFFDDLGSSIGSKLFDAVLKVKGAMKDVKGFFGFNEPAEIDRVLANILARAANDPNGSPDIAPQIVSPGERTARSIEEHRSTSTAEVTIRDETGRAEVTSGTLGNGLVLQKTGSFD